MFTNREEAGLLLANKLKKEKLPRNMYIFAIPRGGVVLGRIISDALHLKLFPLVVKKIGSPKNPELAIGAVGPGNTLYWDEDIVKRIGIHKEEKIFLKQEKKYEVEARERYLGAELPEMLDKTIVVVDDGVATGATVKAGVKYLKKMKANTIILATPVISSDGYDELREDFDRIVYLEKIKYFQAIGEFYEEFYPVSDEKVKEMLNK